AVRTEAIKSLGRLKAGQRILEYKATNDPEAIVRREAKNALKNFEPTEEEAIMQNDMENQN
ncbi:MAG: hypothetical protein ACRCR9_06690, partial [Chitinophagaceae bacterium]